MPFWIEGWVEWTLASEEEESEDAWLGFLRLSPLNLGADEVSEALFGLSKRMVAAGAPSSLAARRGIPPNPSADLRADLRRNAAFEAPYGTDEIGGYTYATWEEVLNFRGCHPVAESSDWALVFDVLDRMTASPQLSMARLRLVAWYNW